MRTPATARQAVRQTWSRVHEVTGPPADVVPAELYVRGAVLGDSTATSTGVRRRISIAPGGVADFGTYCNAFAAGQWRDHAGVRVVRLSVRVDAAAVLTVHRTDAAGAAATGPSRLLTPRTDEAVDIEIGEGDGLLWFDLRAGPRPVAVLDAGWQVRERPRPGGLVIGTPTVGRIGDVAANLTRIGSAPALMAVVDRLVVVDHAPAPIAAALLDTAGAALGDLVRVVRQPNLGGSGGYSRVMHEALAEPATHAVLLLDDDVVAEPAALLKAFEFARRCVGSEIVGLQMLDAGRPAVLEAAAEHIVGRSFWWAPVDAALPGTDVAATPLHRVPSLHGSGRADFAGWWGAVIPLEVVRAIGYAMPFFLKWDDAEYALRAKESGYRTVSMQGAALWHESWRGKDDARTWPAFFHARNRLLAALLHGSGRVRTGVLLASLAVEVKQLLALHTYAVERRQEGVRAVLVGPAGLETAGVEDILRLQHLADGQRRISAGDAASVPEGDRRRAATAPRGARLAAWTVWLLLRHLVVPVRKRSLRLPPGRGTWWVLPWFDDVLTPTADGAAYFRLVRDRRRFRTALATSIALHARLWLAWPRLARRYRSAAPVLVTPAAWRRRFDPEG